jgi:hypothetical protein
MIFELLRDVQVRLNDDTDGFKASVETITGEQELLLEYQNPRSALSLLNAAGEVFGSASWLDGCDSCGWDSRVTVVLSEVQQVMDQRGER